MSAWTLSYPRRVLRAELAERKKLLASIETHINASKRVPAHSRKDCGCIQRRPTLRSEIEQLRATIGLCGAYVEMCREAKRREKANG